MDAASPSDLNVPDVIVQRYTSLCAANAKKKEFTILSSFEKALFYLGYLFKASPSSH